MSALFYLMQIVHTESQAGVKYENKWDLLARIRKPLIWKCLGLPSSHLPKPWNEAWC